MNKNNLIVDDGKDLIPENEINLEEIDSVDLVANLENDYVKSSIHYENPLDYPVVLEVLDPLFSSDVEDKQSAQEFRFYSNKENYWFKQYGLGKAEYKKLFLVRPKTKETINFQFTTSIVKKYWKLEKQNKISTTIRLRFNLHTKEGVTLLLSRKMYIK